MNYEDSLGWLYNLQYLGTKLGLENTRILLETVGNPQDKFRIIHVGGTNGKGSVCAFISGILKTAGFKVGTYTSPHLLEFGERIAINGYPMRRKETVQAIERIKPHIEKLRNGKPSKNCTYFETVTVMALDHFARKKVDLAVLEVGMGGRLDSTNVVNPLVSVITNIGLEHTEHLGRTVDKIAYEKAGIIKKARPLVCGVEDPMALAVIEKKCRSLKAELIDIQTTTKTEVLENDIFGVRFSIETPNNHINEIRIRLAGKHQVKNAALAMAAVKALSRYDIQVSRENIKEGLEKTRWDGRLQVIRTDPLTIVDATHNPPGSETLKAYLDDELQKRRVIGIIGMVKDKDTKSYLHHLKGRFRKLIFTSPEYDRGLPPEDLAASHEMGDGALIIDTVKEAIETAQKDRKKDDMILITGSIFTASEALEILIQEKIEYIMSELKDHYPIGAFPGRSVGDNETALGKRSGDPFKVLISTILSQRTRDENTHVASENLFSKYPTPERLASADLKDVEKLIKPAGFYKVKARKIIDVANIIKSKYDSETPADMDDLLKLPGVGRKTANCVLVYGYGKPAIAVDTHVHRISNLLGLVKTRTPYETEEDLMQIIPKTYWTDINRLIVRHGQTVCRPTSPRCGKCPLSDVCDHGIHMIKKME